MRVKIDKHQPEKEREFDSLNSESDIIDILKTQFRNRKLYLRYSVEKTEFTINEILDDNMLVVATDPEYEHNSHFSIYGLSDKYIEIDMDVIEELTLGSYKCRITSARRAVQGRRDLRFKVTPEQVSATNFKITKSKLDIADFKIPTGIKVLLDQFQASNAKMSDLVKVDLLSVKDTDPVLKAVKKTGKSVFISNTSDPDSYKADSDEFIDLQGVFLNELNAFVKQYSSKGYKSICIVPIVYLNDDEKPIPFAYIQIISKTAFLGIDKIDELKNHAAKLIDRIKDANTNLITSNQPLIDISRGGAKLKITDEELKKSILISKGFVFDILFKLQAPITIYGEIKSTYSDDKGNFFTGVDFAGNSSRKNEMKRYYSILQPMEIDYKSKLLKSMKS